MQRLKLGATFPHKLQNIKVLDILRETFELPTSVI
jgi:hypothetical protein